MTGFYQCVLVGLMQVCKNCTMYVETNAACGSAENEATLHCVLLSGPNFSEGVHILQ